MSHFIKGFTARISALATGRTDPNQERRSPAEIMVYTLRQIALRYRELEANCNSDASRATFSAMAAEYEARANRIEAEQC